MGEKIRLIAVDWGTTNFRAYLLSEHGEVLRQISVAEGILSIRRGEHQRVFDRLLGEWLTEYPGVPVIMAGMIGSKNGWQEVPYLDCPTEWSALAGSLVSVATHDSHTTLIVPGIRGKSVAGNQDVMRGEETIILGALNGWSAADENLMILPGTHSKWALVNSQGLSTFTTQMTGEIFNVLVQHTILGKQLEPQVFNQDVFQTGLAQADKAGGMMHHLFSARACMLKGELKSEHVEAYISGIVIGEEIFQLKQAYPEYQQVTIVSSGLLQEHYQKACSFFNLSCNSVSSTEAFLKGVESLASAAGLVK